MAGLYTWIIAVLLFILFLTYGVRDSVNHNRPCNNWNSAVLANTPARCLKYFEGGQ